MGALDSTIRAAIFPWLRDMRALLLLKLTTSNFFMYIIKSSHDFFFMQFEINKHL